MNKSSLGGLAFLYIATYPGVGWGGGSGGQVVNKIGTERSSDKLVSFRYQTFKYERAWAVVSVARPSSMRGPG